MSVLERMLDKYDGDPEKELISVKGSLVKRRFRNRFNYLKNACKDNGASVSSGKSCNGIIIHRLQIEMF